MDAKVLKNIFIESTQHVLKIMAQCPAVAGKAFIKKDNIALGDYSAYICANCNTNKTRGSISVTFTAFAAKSVAKTMFGEEIDDAQGLREVAGEFVNIISGDARRRMAEQGVVFDGSTPKMLDGEGHKICHETSSPIVVIPFDVPDGKCVVEFGFELS